MPQHHDAKPIGESSAWLATHRQIPWWFASTGTVLDLIALVVFLPFSIALRFVRHARKPTAGWNDYRGLLLCDVTDDSIEFWTAKPTVFRRVPDRRILSRARSTLASIETNGSVVTFRFNTGFLAVLNLADDEAALQALRTTVSPHADG